MSTTTAAPLQRGLFIAGEVQPPSDTTLAITNPGTGEVVGHATRADAAAVDEAVRAAHAAFGPWSALSYSERGEVLHACAEAFAAHETAYTRFLQLYRSADWDAAEGALAECENLGVAGLKKLYHVYRERIDEWRKAPPPADWDGTFTATSK